MSNLLGNDGNPDHEKALADLQKSAKRRKAI
jgi:hypothetical protein